MIFKDSNAKVGRLKAVIKDKTIIGATSTSRSLASLTSKKDRLIKVEILDNGYLNIDFSAVIGTKVRVSKTNALRLTKFIQETYASRSRKK